LLVRRALLVVWLGLLAAALLAAGYVLLLLAGGVSWPGLHAEHAERIWYPDGSYFCQANGGCSPLIQSVQTFVTVDGWRCESVWGPDGSKAGVRCFPPAGDLGAALDDFGCCVADSNGYLWWCGEVCGSPTAGEGSKDAR
jgi:hypothetical protein